MLRIDLHLPANYAIFLPMDRYGVLFVCLGNICRSPLAERVFAHLVAERGMDARFRIESCGTGAWHLGEPAHPGSVSVAERHGISLTNHRARKLQKSDFTEFDLMLVMDEENHQDVMRRCPKDGPRVAYLRDYDSEGDDLNVPDPYYLPGDSFLTVYDIVFRSCHALLDELAHELK